MAASSSTKNCWRTALTEQLTFTRGRVGNKNDQCWVEQKNGSVVRQLVGYDRFEGERAYRQLAELYRAVRLYVNFFQPSMKLRTKTRTGSRVRRMYGPAQTPFQRVLASGVLDAASERRLNAVYRALDPVRLPQPAGVASGGALAACHVSDAQSLDDQRPGGPLRCQRVWWIRR